jgi:hypothetical protein
MASVLFTNPVVAQQVQAAAQNQLAQRQLDLQDRESFLSGIRQAQEVAQRYGAQRYQTDAYRDASMGQNQVGMARVQADTLNSGRELDLKSVMAENDRQFRDRELATRKAIAEINANATRLRPQDLVDLEQEVAATNQYADEFNTTAANAAVIIKSMADKLRKEDEDALTKQGSGFFKDGPFTRESTARKEAQGKLKPFNEYIAAALAATLADNQDLSPFIQIQGTNVVPKLKSFIKAEGGKLVPVTPSAPTVATAPTAPTAAPDWRSLMAGAMGKNAATNNPAALIPRLGASPFSLTNRATGRAFTARPIQ